MNGKAYVALHASCVLSVVRGSPLPHPSSPGPTIQSETMNQRAIRLELSLVNMDGIRTELETTELGTF